jgi:hypothetical protein
MATNVKANNAKSTGQNNNTKLLNSVKANESINKLAPNVNKNTTKNIVNDIQPKKENVSISGKLEEAKIMAGAYDIIAENYFLLVGLSFAIVILILIYFFSPSFRVQRCVDRMSLYQNYQTLTSMDYNLIGTTILCDYYVASAYNPCHCGYQMLDYTSEEVLLSCLQSGVRYIDLSIFNSEYGASAFPVVSMGYRVGEWKMMATDTPLETCFKLISENAFSVRSMTSGVNNYDDPLFIGLNLNTNSNIDCLNLIAALITKYFRDKMLDASYSYQNRNDLWNISMEKLIGKVIFFSSDGFQGSGLEEIINYCWDNYDNNPNHTLQRIHYSTLTAKNFNGSKLIEYNKSGLTIVVPHKEGDILNGNFDTTVAIQCGCQFISMEYQYIDSNMDNYITRFKDKAFILKDDNLQHGAATGTFTTQPITRQTRYNIAANVRTTRAQTTTTAPQTA